MSFEPVFGPASRALILGSWPSPESWRQGFYYGHPRNRFWPLLARQRGSGLPPLRKDAAPGERHRRRAPAQHQPRQRRLRHGKAGRRLGRGAGALAFVSALI